MNVQEPSVSGPCCAHSRVVYAPTENPDGTRSERWTCTDCGTPFVPARNTGEVEHMRVTIESLRKALRMGEVDVALERSWCRTCRTEGRGEHRGRDVHPHDPACLLALAPTVERPDQRDLLAGEV